VEEMLEAGVSGVFQPHGLGHLIGLDVHDVCCIRRVVTPTLGIGMETGHWYSLAVRNTGFIPQSAATSRPFVCL